jgi:hypothetical protein
MNRATLWLPAVAAIVFVPATHGAMIDWEDGLWDHGSGFNMGYDSGAVTGLTNGGFVGVTWSTFGAATGLHSSLGGAQPQVRTDFNGSSTDGALSVATAGDNNAGTRQNYVALTISFATAVNVLNLIVGDVDRGGSTTWEDFIAVEGFLGATLRNTVYSINPGPVNRHELATMFGVAGVRGNNGNVAFDSEEANVGIGFDGPVDVLRLYFHQGSGTTGANEHGVWLRDIEYAEAVPESGTWALMVGGLLGLMSLRWKRLRR